MYRLSLFLSLSPVFVHAHYRVQSLYNCTEKSCDSAFRGTTDLRRHTRVKRRYLRVLPCRSRASTRRGVWEGRGVTELERFGFVKDSNKASQLGIADARTGLLILLGISSLPISRSMTFATQLRGRLVR